MLPPAGPLPTIASLSLGGTRDFLLKHKKDPARRERFPLESGDLIVMRGTTQSNWLHSVPKRAQARGRLSVFASQLLTLVRLRSPRSLCFNTLQGNFDWLICRAC